MMNRNEFIEALRRELRNLPQDEIDAAVEYYEEYFDEAGPDREQEVLEGLDSPKKIAGQIKSEYAVRRLDEESGSTARKGLSAVWWVIIGICSAPLSIPAAIALVALAVCGFAVALAVVVSVFAAVIGVLVAALGMLVLGIIAIPVTLSVAVMLIGGGLLSLALFAAIGVLAVIGLRKIVAAMVKWLRNKNEVYKAQKTERRYQG